VYLRADPQLTSLYDFETRPLYAAEDGARGQGANRTGKAGHDLYLDVPCGTQVWPHPRGEAMLGDLVEPGQALLVAPGGRGGRGNKALASATYQTPREAEDGEPGVERLVDLELKLIADVGLVGLPNAGKSTLLRRLSRARPRVAAYPFTTLHPHLGICALDEDRRLVIADIPGLIEGASQGAGLGHEFLRHLERTRVLAHLVAPDEAAGAEELDAALKTVEDELAAHSRELAAKPRLIVLTKLDLFPDDEGDRLVAALAERLGTPVHGISAVTGRGVRDLTEAVFETVTAAKGEARA
jgi:GTP-binding protein